MPCYESGSSPPPILSHRIAPGFPNARAGSGGRPWKGVPEHAIIRRRRETQCSLARETQAVALSPLEVEIAADLRSRQAALESLAAELVGINSGTAHHDGVNRVGRAVEAHLLGSGLRTGAFVTGRSGQHVIARTGTSDGHKLLLLGHLDTVYPNVEPLGAWRISADDPERVLGPGVTDMKGGLVVMLGALRVLAERGLLRDRALTVFLSADEEQSAVTSRDLIANEAADHHLCLVFETGSLRAGGAATFVIERKGLARYTLAITGCESHAGAAKGEGVSAAVEAAHKILAIEALNDAAAGVSANVGVVSAGTTANTVPGAATLEIDCRFKTEDQAAALDEAMDEICAQTQTRDAAGMKAPVLTLVRGPSHPPMTPTDASRRMAKRIVDWGADLGLALETEARGGSSDGNITAAAGCPTVDGLGTVGGAIHSPDEWMLRRSLSERAALLAITMLRFYAL
jgi:glutamate carboxypeptidase